MHYRLVPDSPLARVCEDCFHVGIGQELGQVIDESRVRLLIKRGPVRMLGGVPGCKLGLDLSAINVNCVSRHESSLVGAARS